MTQAYISSYPSRGFLQSEPMGIERLYSLQIFVAEMLLYTAYVGRVFGHQLGVYRLQGIMGVVSIGTAGLTMLLLLGRRERLPLGFWFLLGMNILANLSNLVFYQKVPFMGGTDDFKQLILPLCHFLLIYAVLLNRQAYHRWLLLMGVSIVVAVVIGGTLRQGAIYSTRLRLESIAGAYANANDLAYGVATAAIGLLFYSLRTKGWLRPAIWGLTVVLLVILLQTLSRGGLVAFAGGCCLFLLTVAGARGMRLKGIVGLMFFIGIAAVGGHLVTQQVTDIKTRFGQSSVRTENFIHVWSDLPGTIIKGKGGIEFAAVEYTGIHAHNTFFNLHLAWGGPVAYLFLAWMVVVAIRLRRMLFTSTVPLHLRMELTAMLFVAFMSCMMSNNGLLHFGTVTALALSDKYLVGFSGSAIQRRRYLEYQQRGLLQYAAPAVQPLARS